MKESARSKSQSACTDTMPCAWYTTREYIDPLRNWRFVVFAADWRVPVGEVVEFVEGVVRCDETGPGSEEQTVKHADPDGHRDRPGQVRGVTRGEGDQSHPHADEHR